MLLFHLHWLTPTEAETHGRVFLWAENATADQPRRDRRKKSTQPHPFTASANDLRHTLSQLLPSLGKKLATESLTLWLPTNQFGPVPSHGLPHSWEQDNKPLQLLSWSVPGLSLTSEAMWQLLLHLHQHPLPMQIRLGVDSQYWQMTFAFVLELLTRQLYRPTLVQQGALGQFEARWQPVVDGDGEAERMARLALGMPPVCRAEAADPAETIPPGAILDSFVNHMLDTAVRDWGTRQELYLPTANDPASAWLRALFATDPTIKSVSAGQLQHFASSFRAWERALTVAGDKFYRVALRLEAPAQQKHGQSKKGEVAWQLHYLLQARDEASLVVPASEVWKTKGSVLQTLDRHFDRPQERLLTGLGYAARFFKPIERSLQQRHPAQVALTTDEAYAFLRQCAPQLQRAGFGLLTPPWWNKPGTRLGMRLRLSKQGSSGQGNTAVSSDHLTLDNLVQYKWELALGDTKLNRDEFDALVALKSPLVQIRGQWVQLDPEQIEAAIRFWEEQELEGTLSLQEAAKLGLTGQSKTESGLPFEEVELDDWLQSWLNRLQGDEKLAVLPPPDGLQATLRPYQQYGYSWLHFARRWGMGVILADDMGLGKCVAPDTQIMVNGVLQTAENIWLRFVDEESFDGEGFWSSPRESVIVNSLNESSGKIVNAPIKRLYRQAVKERLQHIVLEDGNHITITQQHKLFTPSGWKKRLEIGDYVGVPAKMLWHGRALFPPLVQFLAWQIAEGYELTKRATLIITQKEVSYLHEFNSYLEQIAHQYSLKINQPAIREPRNRSPYLVINSRAYQTFLEDQGYEWGHKSANKKIPAFIMQGDNNSVALFLKHFFEAEASVSTSTRTIEISSASSELISQLAVLLKRFAIWMRITSKQKRATNGSNIYRTYYFGLIGGNGARLFSQEIGFVSERKGEKLNQICQVANNTNIEGIPVSQLVADLVASTQLPVRHLGMHNTVYINGTQEFSHKSLQKVVASLDKIISGDALDAYQQKPRSKWTDQTVAAYEALDHATLREYQSQLQQFLDEEIFYCKVKHIEWLDYEGWVYDFEVAEHHNFVANNIICHNTIQTLTLTQQLKEELGDLPAPILLICPTSVVTNWEQEKEKFTPHLRTLLHQGSDRLQGDALREAAQASDLVLTSYALVRRDGATLQQIEWLAVVLDEAQNIKNPQTKQAQTIRQLTADFRLALTGTPVENRLSELWSIMQFLNPGFLGSRKQFRQDFVLPIEKYGDEEAARQLRQSTRPFILRRVKTDPTVIQDLPDKQELKVYCHLSEEQATLYEAVVRDSISAIDAQEEGIARKGMVLSLLMQLKQVCNHPAQYLHEAETYDPLHDHGRSGKLARFDSLLEEILAEGDRMLIFSQFTEMAGLLQKHIQTKFGVPTLYLHGGVPAKKRAGMVTQFQGENGPPIFLLSLKAGGTGLNLTRANHVFHFDRWWNPAVEDQATDRAFRIGQTKNVLVHKFVCLGTLEERIDAMIEEKKALAESIIGGGENWLTEMSTTDLRELVSLRK